MWSSVCSEGGCKRWRRGERRGGWGAWCRDGPALPDPSRRGTRFRPVRDSVRGTASGHPTAGRHQGKSIQITHSFEKTSHIKSNHLFTSKWVQDSIF